MDCLCVCLSFLDRCLCFLCVFCVFCCVFCGFVSGYKMEVFFWLYLHPPTACVFLLALLDT